MSKNLEVVNCIEDMMDSTRSSVFLPGKEEYRRDNDIVLAAELGKVLLDRNRSLEQALQESRLSEQEKTAEIKFLVEQLAYLRESSLQKSAFADQADCYNQELDRNNRRLVQEMMADKRKIERMSVKIARLEEQVTNLLDRLAEYESVDGPRHSLHSGTRPSSGSSDRRNMDPTQFTPSSITASSDYPQIFIDDEFVDQPQLGAYLSRDTLKPSSPEYTRQLAAPYLRLPCPSRKDSSQLSYSSPCLLQMDIKEPASVLNKTFNLTRGSRGL
ncbi:unnamed protein product [Calicophoron daubneyi]|uniref:HAP1 N-terminal domain-containing protein n=1 Tax=Calicophoron daubneyi TaxID=300641 RepID=A0AAV2TR38_CALDB